MSPYDRYVEDTDKLVMSGKQIREYRDICRREGYLQALEDCLNIVSVRDEGINIFTKINNLKKQDEESK